MNNKLFLNVNIVLMRGILSVVIGILAIASWNLPKSFADAQDFFYVRNVKCNGV
jgi:hypothetical protein